MTKQTELMVVLQELKDRKEFLMVLKNLARICKDSKNANIISLEVKFETNNLEGLKERIELLT